ncbi:hypothetical protein GCM10027085_27920 [Spirosoma aerophilum]
MNEWPFTKDYLRKLIEHKESGVDLKTLDSYYPCVQLICPVPKIACLKKAGGISFNAQSSVFELPGRPVSPTCVKL